MTWRGAIVSLSVVFGQRAGREEAASTGVCVDAAPHVAEDDRHGHLR